jgi:hypothetical protein
VTLLCRHQRRYLPAAIDHQIYDDILPKVTSVLERDLDCARNIYGGAISLVLIPLLSMQGTRYKTDGYLQDNRHLHVGQGS